MERKKRQTSILWKILIPMLVFLLLQTTAIWAIVFGTGIMHEVEQNAFETFNERVSTRKTYLQSEMVQRWGNLSNTVAELNGVTDRLGRKYFPQGAPDLSDGYLTVEADGRTELFSDVFLAEAYPALINLIKTDSVTGAFIVFKAPAQRLKKLNGLYLRCETPAAVVRESLFINVASDYMKLRMREYASYETRAMSQFDFTGVGAYEYFYKPYDAYAADGTAGWQDCDYWASPHRIHEDSPQVISYSVPLTAGGVSYGVLGVDLSLSYLEKSLPYREINGLKNGAYILAERTDEGYDALMHTGPDYGYMFGSGTALTLEETDYGGEFNFYTESTQGKEDAFLYCEKLKLYNANSYYKDEGWYLMGLLTEDVLLGFSRKFLTTIIVSFVVGDAVGVALLLIVAWRISAPVSRLPEKVRALGQTASAGLERTGIREIDGLIDSIENLRASVMESSEKMSKIIELSGVRLGAFEVDFARGKASFAGKLDQVTDRSDFAGENVDAAAFLDYLRELDRGRIESDANTLLYSYVDSSGSPRFVNVRVIQGEGRILGIMQDATEDRLERNRIAYERDYDLLTGLLNRRAFLTRAQKATEARDTVKNAAFILLDMDNLKVLNDTFGHEQGDEYLRSMAKTLKAFIASGEALIGRLSGDEFVMYFYGYETPETLGREIKALQAFIAAAVIMTPTGQKLNLRCSAGVAYYPKDGGRIDDLLLYADYAMYEIKQTTRGEFNEFSRERYNNREYRTRGYEDLNALIENNLVEYDFQPIVSLKTGEIYGYEALMRPTCGSLKTPQEVLAMARAQHKLYYIERLTWPGALEAFSQFTGKAATRCLFINSVPSQLLSEDDIALLEGRYGPLLKRTVIEFTEDEKLNEEYAMVKKKLLRSWGGKVALDDFGTGYSTDTVLLILNPDFIKVDMFIVRGIDKSANKRKLLENIVSYASDHKMRVIAEGVETREELETVIRYGVDYVQGFYVARPQKGQSELKSEKRREIRDLYGKIVPKTPKKRDGEPDNSHWKN